MQNSKCNAHEANPQDVEVIGGKTGTTDEAGCCLCLLAKD